LRPMKSASSKSRASQVRLSAVRARMRPIRPAPIRACYGSSSFVFTFGLLFQCSVRDFFLDFLPTPIAAGDQGPPCLWQDSSQPAPPSLYTAPSSPPLQCLSGAHPHSFRCSTIALAIVLRSWSVRSPLTRDPDNAKPTPNAKVLIDHPSRHSP